MHIAHAVSIASLALALILTLHTQSAPPATAANGPAQHWRYLAIQLLDGAVTEYFYVSAGSGRQVTTLLSAPDPNDPNASKKYETAWGRAIAQAGLDGWELVSVVQGTGLYSEFPYVMYFKRPL